MILTSPMLQNSPTNSASPIRNAIDTAGEPRPPGTPTFGKVLANEINDKKDVSETLRGEASTTPDTALNKGLEKMDTAAGEKDLGDPENMENSRVLKSSKDLEGSAPTATETRKKRETKVHTDAPAAAIATSPQPINLADILHGLIVAYSPATSIENRTASIEASAESPADARAVDAAIDAQAELPAAADPQAGFLVMLPGLAARPGKAEPDASAAMAAMVKSDLTPRSLSIRAAAATEMREKHAAGVQDTQELTALKRELDAGQDASQQVGFSSPEITAATQTGKSEKSLPEFASKDLQTSGLFNTTATPIGVAADRSIAPAAAGMPVYAGLSLEPRVAATGWDNALGQKVLWMVSQQQQVVELTLNPPDLGPLQVVLSIHDDQASATFVSPHADVRHALEAALPRLREMMADSGISLSNTTVSDDTSQQQGGFERQDRSASRHEGSGRAVAVSNAHGAPIGMSHVHGGASRLVDIFA